MKVVIGGYSHETNTFALEQNFTHDARIHLGKKIIESNQGKKTCISGFLDVAEKKGFEIIPTADIGFIHGGLIKNNIFEYYRDLILKEVEQVGRVDGYLFRLHGAMCAEEPYLDAEEKFLEALRGSPIVGDEVPIACTYDFHGNMTDLEVQLAYPCGYNHNPHIDGYERGVEAAETIVKMIDREIEPITVRKWVPILGPNVGMSTWSHLPEEEKKLPMYKLNLLRNDVEKIDGVLNATIFGGYSYSDCPEPGVSIIVSTDEDTQLAEEQTLRLAKATWEIREEFVKIRPLYPVDKAVKMAMESKETPVLIVDVGDDPGSACPADSPVVLEALIRLGASDATVTIRDPEAVEKALSTGIGEEIETEIGGRIDKRFYKPIKVKGTVKALDDGVYYILGPTHGGWGRDVRKEAFREVDVLKRAVIRTGDRIDIVLSKRRTGKDRDFFKSIGVQIPEGKKIIVVKSTQAHRASFDPIVKKTIEVDSPGVSTPGFYRLPYKYIKRPIWPLDKEMFWKPV
jgi:microcystin degradation protein MlrC